MEFSMITSDKEISDAGFHPLLLCPQLIETEKLIMQRLNEKRLKQIESRKKKFAVEPYDQYLKIDFKAKKLKQKEDATKLRKNKLKTANQYHQLQKRTQRNSSTSKIKKRKSIFKTSDDDDVKFSDSDNDTVVFRRVSQRKYKQKVIYGPTIINVQKEMEKQTAEDKQFKQRKEKIKQFHRIQTTKQSHYQKNDEKDSSNKQTTQVFIDKNTQKQSKKSKDIKPSKKYRNKEHTEIKQKKSHQKSNISRQNQEDSSVNQQSWQQQLRKLTKYNPNDKKYKKRDKMPILQSSAAKMISQDKMTYMIAKKDELQDEIKWNNLKKHKLLQEKIKEKNKKCQQNQSDKRKLIHKNHK